MIPSPNCTRLLITCDDATRAEKSRLVEDRDEIGPAP